ncbi:hypothetical protein [Coralloluteibacterium stylophorae]|uniref:Uncharacterized protein n=1 Tax=Coralloluteibacterium stylophorae TaxID=1776034 RepID=A0A8J7VTB4_9GAMM|nr:hypothetical protein [Coralloluteibacterium stylophorae]MBS7457697.1 hypothetical protein [Coralloluteibacterium stylophorae]
MFEHLAPKGTSAFQQTPQDVIAAGEREQQQEAAEASFVDLAASYWNQGIPGALGRGLRQFAFESDDEWQFPADLSSHLKQYGVSEEQAPLLYKARSQEHLLELTSYALENQDDAKLKSQFGFWGNLAASATDPAMLLADVASAGLAHSATAGRAINAARAATTGATVNAAGTAAASTFNPEMGARDVLMDAAAGFAFAGVLGARNGAKFDEMGAVRRGNAAFEAEIKAAAAPPDDSLSAARVAETSPDVLPGLNRLHREGPSDMERLDAAQQEAGVRGRFLNARLDLSASFGKSKSPLVRYVGRQLVRDGVGYTDRNLAVTEAASEFSRRHTATVETEFMASMNAAWQSAAKALNVRASDDVQRRVFMHEVGRAVRGADDVSPQARAAASVVAKTNSRLLKLAQETGVQGFENIAENANYLQRAFSPEGYHRVFGEMGVTEDEFLEQVLKPAMRKEWEKRLGAEAVEKNRQNVEAYRGTSDGVRKAREALDTTRAQLSAAKERLDALEAKADTPTKNKLWKKARDRKRENARRQVQKLDTLHRRRQDEYGSAVQKERDSGYAEREAGMVSDGIDDKLLDAVARAWLKRGQKVAEGDYESGVIRGLDEDDIDALDELLTDLEPAKRQEVLNLLKKGSDGPSKSDRAKRRIDLDETFRTTVTREDGSTIEVGIADLLDNDVERVTHHYIREMVGQSALADRVGVKSPSEFRRLRKQVEEEAKRSGDAVAKTLEHFDLAVRAIRGQSTEKNPHTAWSRAGRMLRDVNFVRTMNQAGFSMFAEVGPMLAQVGVKNFVRSIPYASSAFKRMQNGTLASEEARVLEWLFAPGTGMLRNPPWLRLDEGVLAGNFRPGNRGADVLDNGLQRAKHVTNILSGLGPLNAVFQRMAGHASLYRLMDLAKKPSLSAAETRRLRNLGLDEGAQRELFDYLKGLGSIRDIDPNALSFNARERVAATLHRMVTHQILEGDVGDTLAVMHSPVGKLAFQFQTFVVQSYTRHFLHSAANLDDWRTWAMLTTSFGMAGIGWSARTYLNTIGDEEQRKRQLTMANLAKSAFQQSSWASVLPAAWDTIYSDILQNDPTFRYGRSTGLDTGIGGIPSIDLMKKLYSLPGTAVSAARTDREVTQQQFQDAWRVMPWNNLTVVRNIANAVARELPKEDEGRLEDREDN